MKFKLLAVIFLVVTVLLSANAFAATEIGSGYQCSGDQIIKKNKVVKYSKAKSTTAQTLENLKESLGNATSKSKKDAIKAKIEVVKGVAKSLKLCSKGQLAEGTVDPLFTQLASNGGTYTGTYSGTVQSFLGNINVSGDLSYKFTVTGTVFKIAITVGGNVGSALGGEPLEYEADVNGQALPFQIQIPDTFLGNVNMEIKADGSVNIASPNDQVTFKGQFTNTTATGTIKGVNYKNTNFEGSYTLTK